MQTGEWVLVNVSKWDVQFVEVYEELQSPLEFELMNVLPEYPDIELPMDFVEGRWFLAASGSPAFKIKPYKGTVQRVQYYFHNVKPGEYQPPACIVDWPQETEPESGTYLINHCPNIVSDPQ